MEDKSKLGNFAIFVLAILSALGIYLGPRPEKPKPTPTPEPTATVAPTVEPTPTPLPTPPPSTDCSRFVVTDAKCVDKPTTPSLFRDAVKQAQEKAAANGFVVGDWVVGEIEYTNEVARLLRAAGFKATSCGLADEVWVAGPGFSEHFDIVTSELMAWTHYAARCEPEKWRQ